MAARKVELAIRRYIKILKKHGINVRKAILYGSHVHGRANRDSDIDLAVISPDFGKDYLDEAVRLKLLTLGVDTDISPRPYSTEEEQRAGEGSFLHDEILNKGLVVYQSED